MNVGYCTNIHSGASFPEVMSNLQRYAVPIKARVSADQAMGIGLWFSAAAVEQVLAEERWRQLRDFLEQNDLVAHTFNAFPYSNFHEPVVKHRVYQPDWAAAGRLQYTQAVCELLARLLPAGSVGTVSTLPLGWPPAEGFHTDSAACQGAARHLIACARHLVQLQSERGVDIRLCIEPEPGCLLDTGPDVIRFFETCLFPDGETERVVRQHLGICHDICHSAVMFESQAEVLSGYEAAGIRVGKVQISSALEANLAGSATDADRIGELEDFVEPRYLHQTHCRNAAGELRFFEDLPDALAAHRADPRAGRWRTHFHVPIMMPGTGGLATTRPEIVKCLDWLVARGYESQFEVETYAWEVSPASIRSGSLVDSVASELAWLKRTYPNLSALNQLRQTG